MAGSAVSCSSEETRAPENRAQNTASAAAPSQTPQSTPDPQAANPQKAPAKDITGADIAKIKWIQGSFRGTGADKPFFNKYAWNGTTLNIQSFNDEAMTKQAQASSFVLKDGMFANPDGETRFAASEITDTYVQFVALGGKTETFRMERKGDGTLEAILEWTGQDGNPTRKSYILEPLKK